MCIKNDLRVTYTRAFVYERVCRRKSELGRGRGSFGGVGARGSVVHDNI